ncbi:MAG TPA: hypothetical protein VK607_10570 [Kofleriaceae bacterium]|nr:hypothetical protein [Kofleriaceae bacterium]
MKSPETPIWQDEDAKRDYRRENPPDQVAFDSALARAAQAEQEAEAVVCPGCRKEIDPETCGCGSHRRNHWSPMEDGHGFVPIGCDCHRPRPEAA